MPWSNISLDALITKLPAADQEFIARIQSLRSPEVTATHSGPPHLPSPQRMAEHFSRIVAKWVPHVFTPSERNAVRADCVRYMVVVHAIEQVQKDIHPRQLPEEQHNPLCRMGLDEATVDARLHITWTCKRWREIALSDSTLWNTIWFRAAGARLERAWAWFERARQAPLDVRIDGGSDGLSHDDNEDNISKSDALAAVTEISNQRPLDAGDIPQILPRLFTKLTTIRMLIIVVNDWESAILVLELLRARGSSGVPLLQRFELHRGMFGDENRRTSTWPQITIQPFLGGAAAPSLAYLSLNGVVIDWARSIVANLTTLDLRRLPSTYSPDDARFREILADCPRLQKLLLDGAGPKFQKPDGETMSPIDLPYMHTLVIADFSLQHAQLLFSQFTAPNVNDLILMNVCGDNYLPLFVQITGVFPKVQLLTTYSIQFSSTPEALSTMTRWLDSMPFLAHLRVANVANQFFGIFFRSDNMAKPVAPKLVTVDFQSIEPDIITQWVSDRHMYKTPLRQVYISEDLRGHLKNHHIEALTSRCILAILPRGATTPEEEALSRLAPIHISQS